MNYMKQVAEMLGVEMGERFNVTDKIGGYAKRDDYYLTNEGLMREGFTSSHRKVLADILVGKIKIVKKPWKPKFGEIYHFVTTGGAISQMACTECTFDCALALIGNRFRTEAEAKPHVDEMVAKLREVMDE